MRKIRTSLPASQPPLSYRRIRWMTLVHIEFYFQFHSRQEDNYRGVVLKVEDYQTRLAMQTVYRYDLRLNCKSVVLPKKGRQKFCMECLAYLIKRFSYFWSQPCLSSKKTNHLETIF